MRSNGSRVPVRISTPRPAWTTLDHSRAADERSVSVAAVLLDGGPCPGPRLVGSIEGTRSYGLGLTRAITAAGLAVLECEQPTRKTRRGKGKSDAIDAHLAVLAALQLDTDRLPIPRADGDREALRILLSARQELTTTGTAQTNRLRALLLGGDDNDRERLLTGP